MDNPQESEIEIKQPSKGKTLFGILLILVSIAAYTFYTRSLAESASAIDVDIEQKSDQIKQLKTQIEEFEQAEDELEISTAVKKLEILKAIPTEMEQDEVLRDILDISDTHDIELRSINFGQGSAGKEGIASLRVNSSFEGNYNDLINFLRGLEQNDRLFQVSSISVQFEQLAISDINRATFTLAMEAYFQQ